MKTVKLLALAAALVFSSACKKKEEAKKDPTGSAATGSAAMAGSGSAAPTPDTAGSAAMAGSGSGAAMAGSDTAMAGSGAGSAAATPTDDTADWITVQANHFEKKEGDPVAVKFEKFKVVKASFDPKKIEGGTAQLEIDLTSLKTGDVKRDEHVNTPDYLDTAKFATATVDIGNVKKKDDKTYTADAKVKVHGVEKKLPVTFEVVDAKDDWVRIKGEAAFKRLDFKVGKKPGPDMKKGDDGVADDMTVKLQLTLKKA
jgi:polyisoprenoid-binding protein YceI